MQTYYVVKKPEIDDADNGTLTTLAPLLTTAFNDSNATKVVEEFERKLRYIDGMNVLGSIFQFLLTTI